jgi:hypothetical protein
VDTSTALVLRHALNTVAACFTLQDAGILSGNIEGYCASVAAICDDAV